ncbi:permease-like cell division protein FtsX [Nonomuraea sp. NPDC049714]|uniref:permease-like cell division protein FtsX n=1 Tax=Nonomuraea sp. NPDC049714 TaxID=3364357 RepID=UPI0037A7F3A0
MNSPMEDRLRQALAEAGATVDTSTLRPLHGSQRSRFRVDLRLVAVAAVVVLVGVAGAVGMGGPGDVDHAVAVNPEPDRQKGKGEAAVFLCSKAVPKERLCQGRDVTAAETKAVDALVRQLPEVEAVVFVDQVRAYESFRRDFVHNKALMDSVGAVDLPASFRLTIREGADPKQVSLALRGVPGIQNVVDLPSGMAADRVETTRSVVRAFLCGKGATQVSCGAEQVLDGEGTFKGVKKEGKAVTNAEKNALRRLIESRPDVESFTFVDQAAAYEDFQRSLKSESPIKAKVKVTDMPESFVLTMKPEVDRNMTIDKLKRQSGVATVVDGACAADTSLLIARYGLILPKSTVCSGRD